MDFIIKNSEIGKKKFELINNLNKKNIDELKKKEKILNDLENEIISKRNVKILNIFFDQMLKYIFI